MWQKYLQCYPANVSSSVKRSCYVIDIVADDLCMEALARAEVCKDKPVRIAYFFMLHDKIDTFTIALETVSLGCVELITVIVVASLSCIWDSCGCTFIF